MAESSSSTNAKSALCIKLSQLEKVVEYLSFHTDEHFFQVEELQKRYEKEEDRITDEALKEIESIYSGLEADRLDTHQRIDNDYKNQINDLKSEFLKFRSKIFDETKNQIKIISSDIDICNGKIKRINKEMRKEVTFLQDNSKVDPMNVQKRLREMVEHHRATLETHDKESQRKQKVYEDQTSSAQNEISKKYMKTINNLKEKLRPPPHIRNQIIQSLKAMKKELFNLRNELNRVRNQAKKFITISYSEKLPEIHQVAIKMKEENEQFTEDYEKAKALLQEATFQIKGEKNILLDQLRNQRVDFSDEINKLQDELECCSDPVYLKKKNIEIEEENIENNLKNIQKQIDEIKDLNALHEKEKNDLKMKFEEDIKSENELFEEKKKLIEDQIQTQKVYQEKLNEKERLLQYKKSLFLPQQSTTISPISIKVEINEIETLFNKEYAKSKIDKKDLISKFFIECDSQLDRRKNETKDEYEKQISSITNEYKDSNIIPNITKQYEELLSSLESQLSQIEVPAKNNVISISDFQKRQKEFQNKINQERSELIQNYEKLIQEEDERFRNTPAFLDDTDFTEALLAKNYEKKECLAKYDEQIKLLEDDRDKIEATITLDEDLKKLKEESQFQIKRALQQKTDESKSLIAEITACSEKYSNLIHEESLSSSNVSFQSNCDKLNQDIQLKRQQIDRQIFIEKKSFEKKSKNMKTSFSKELKKFRDEILSLKNSIKEDEKQFNIEKEQKQSKLNIMLAKAESEIISQKPISIPPQTFIEYDNKITLLQRERDRIKRLSNNSNSLMREEERIEVDRLEIELCDKSRELAQLGKDLVIARELSLREKEKENGDVKLNKIDNQVLQRYSITTALNKTGKPNTKRQVASSVEIKRPNMSRTTGQILNLK